MVVGEGVYCASGASGRRGAIHHRNAVNNAVNMPHCERTVRCNIICMYTVVVLLAAAAASRGSHSYELEGGCVPASSHTQAALSKYLLVLWLFGSLTQ